MQENEFHYDVAVGNAFQLSLLVELTDGTQIPASALSDVSVSIGVGGRNMKAFAHTTDGTYIQIQIPADQELGAYDVHVSAKIGNRPIAAHYKALINRVQWGMAAPVEAINGELVVIGVSDAELDAIKVELQTAISAANASKAAADAKVAEYAEKIQNINDIAKESTITSTSSGLPYLKTWIDKIWVSISGVFTKTDSIIGKIGAPKDGAEYSTIYGAIEANAGSSGDIPADQFNQLAKAGRAGVTLATIKDQIGEVDDSGDDTIFSWLNSIIRDMATSDLLQNVKGWVLNVFNAIGYDATITYLWYTEAGSRIELYHTAGDAVDLGGIVYQIWRTQDRSITRIIMDTDPIVGSEIRQVQGIALVGHVEGIERSGSLKNDVAKLATEANATSNKQAIINAIDDLPIPSVTQFQDGLSKAGEYNTKLEEISDGIGDVESVLEEIEEGGIPVVAQPATYEQVASISTELTKIGTPKSGATYSTLFGAIEANAGSGGGGEIPTEQFNQLAKASAIGTSSNSNYTTLFGAFQYLLQAIGASESVVGVKESIQKLVDYQEQLITKRNAFGTYVFTDDHIADSITEVLFSKNLLKSITDENVTTIRCSSALSGCSSLQSVSMPNLTSISGNNALTSCGSLQSVSMPNLTSISGGYTFQSCSSLQSVSMPNLTSISGGNAFHTCNNLQSVSMPNLTSISGGYAFYNCSNLQSVSIPNLTSIIGASVFTTCAKLIDITIGAKMTSSFSLSTWNPTTVLGNDVTKAQLLKNIREHIAANLSESVTATITFSSAVKAAIQADEETMAAFPSSWTIA